MKTVGIASFIGLLALIVSCSAPETVIDSDTVSSDNKEVDTLELARRNRVDSVSQITMPSTVKTPKTIGKKKVVKQ